MLQLTNNNYNMLLLKFMARLMCREKPHSHKKPYVCGKHNSLLFNCSFCMRKSRMARYIYKCPLCHTCFCTVHYIAHTYLFQTATGIHCTSSVINFNDDCSHFLAHTQLNSLAINLSKPIICLKLSKSISDKAEIISSFIKAQNIQQLSIV